MSAAELGLLVTAAIVALGIAAPFVVVWWERRHR